MSTYADSGVNMTQGDLASSIAYSAAKSTFPGRKGMIGEPVIQDWGFAGCLDMGDFYLVQNDDGVGSKEVIAEEIGQYDTLGYDLLAMVIDDAACVGAEVITCSNTIDIKKVEAAKIEKMMNGFASACREHKVVIPGGEIAELNSMINSTIWNATSVGIVEKHKLITSEKVKEGDKVIALSSRGFRSNGFSLVRHILTTRFGEKAFLKPYNYEGGNESFNFAGVVEKTWGEMVLAPSRIFYSYIMDLHGRYKEPSKIDLHGVAHVTGGGIPGNIVRILKKKDGTRLGVELDNLPAPHEMMLKLQKIGDVSDEESYEVWNMGVGMFIIVDEKDTDKALEFAKKHEIPAQVAGVVTTSGVVRLTSKGAMSNGKVLEFKDE